MPNKIEQEESILFRKRINEEIGKVFEFPVTVISAPMGYGKTTAAVDYFQKNNINTIWISLDIAHGSTNYFWNRFCTQLSKTNPNLSEKIEQLGFPIDAPQKATIVDLICDEKIDLPIIIVIDDFHLAQEGIGDFVITLAKQKKLNLHFVLLTRENENETFDSQCHLMNKITIDLLKFNEKEIEEYLKMLKIKATKSEIAELKGFTDGWIVMIYLIALGMKKGQSIREIADVNLLIEKNIYNSYEENERIFLQKLALMEQFSIEQAEFVFGEDNLDSVIRKFNTQNALIVYDSKSKKYQIHSVLLEFLKKQKELSDEEKNQIFEKMAQCFFKEKNYVDSFLNYKKAGKSETVIEIMSEKNSPRVSYYETLALMEIFNETPIEKATKYPLTFLDYSVMLLLSGNEEEAMKAGNILGLISEFYKDNTEVEESLKNFILGEVEVCSIFASFNDVEKICEHVENAKELLNGEFSMIVDRKSEFTFGSPHISYSYYRQPGNFEETCKSLAKGFKEFALVADGCGTGCDYLAMAELALETGDLKLAKTNAERAIHKARTKEQACICAAAYLTLIRAEIANGEFGKAMKILSQCENEIHEENNAILNTTVDLISGYVFGILDRPEKIPEWLRCGNMSEANFIYQGMSWNFIIFGKATLLESEFTKLDVICESFEPYFGIFQNQLGFLHNYIHRSVAKLKLEGLESGIVELEKALEIGREDNIILPFAENYTHISHMLENIDDKSEYFEKLLIFCHEYQRKRKTYVEKKTLSSRENEILQLLAQGLTRENVASTLGISISTVKKHVESIYKKLQVNNLASAISELNLKK